MNSLFSKYGSAILLNILSLITVAQEEGDWVRERLDQGYSLVSDHKLDSARVLFTELNEALEIRDSDRLAKTNLYIGRIYHSSFIFEESIYYLQKAVEQVDSINQKQLRVDILIELGAVFFDSGRLVNAMEEYTHATEIAYSIQDTFGLAILNNNIGLIYLETHDYQRSIEYFKNVTHFAKTEETEFLRAISLNNMGIAYYHLEEYTKSIDVLNAGEIYAYSSQRDKELADILFSKGLNYIELNENKKALELFEKAKKTYSELNFSQRIILCDVSLYKVNYDLGNFEKSKALEVDLIKVMRESLPTNIRVDFYQYLSTNYANEGDSSTAYRYAQKLIELNGSLLEELQSKTLVNLKTDVEIMKVSEELSEIEAAHTKTKTEKEEIESINAELKSMNFKIVLLSALAGTLLILILSLLVRSNKKKKKTNKILETQKSLLADQNSQILNSVSYANSMEKLLLQQMSPHFIFNALTTAEASISVGDYDYAKKYLAMFASLLRQTLDYSRNNVVSLEEEINFLKSYIEINSLKQGTNFNCSFLYDKDEIEDFVFTPPMLVQPFVENALIHGLYHKISGDKELSIKVIPKENYILWEIKDNGIGREKSRQIAHVHKGISHGIKITSDRIKWMKNIHGDYFSLEYKDLEEGTLVILKTPIVEMK